MKQKRQWRKHTLNWHAYLLSFDNFISVIKSTVSKQKQEIENPEMNISDK